VARRLTWLRWLRELRRSEAARAPREPLEQLRQRVEDAIFSEDPPSVEAARDLIAQFGAAARSALPPLENREACPRCEGDGFGPHDGLGPMGGTCPTCGGGGTVSVSLAPDRFACLVCGYPSIEEDPAKNHYNICPSCGAEFGYDNSMIGGYECYRAEWIAGGCQWWARDEERKPEGWDGPKQLAAYVTQLAVRAARAGAEAPPS
jgi:hypothetical protein